MLTSSASFLIGLAATTLGVVGLIFFAYQTTAVRELIRRRVDVLSPVRGGTDTVLLETPTPLPTRDLAGAQLELARRLDRFHVPAAWIRRLFPALQLFGALLLGPTVGLIANRWFAIHSLPMIGGVLVLGSALGWRLPNIVADWLIKQRRLSVAAGLPEALDLLVVAIEAGLPLEGAIARISAEIRLSQPEMAEELAITSADLRMLPDRDDALRRMIERIDLASMHSVVTTLSQTLRYGTPLAQALRVVASELRNDALMRLEERVNRLPVYLTIPMILFILPTLFLIIMGPAALKTLDVFR